MNSKVVGIGVDIVNNNRIAHILNQQYYLRFINKVLHQNEIAYYHQIKEIKKATQFIASRWAAKEALVKASSYKCLIFPETEIVKQTGQPMIHLHGSNSDYFYQKYGEYEIHLSISHEDQNSIAFVLLQTLK